MCGIAGYSLSPASTVNRTLAAQALLAGIAERGADAVGYAYRSDESPVTVHKRRSGATALLDEIDVPQAATQALVHVRDYTKGHPRIEANNHPIRHGAVVGIHNGIIVNDEEILARYGFERAEPEMTVDSEAIFALAEHAGGTSASLEELHGAMATAWLDERLAPTLFLARGVGRPLWVGTGGRELFFASTRDALEVLERTLRLGLRKREVDEGTLVRVESGAVASVERFRPDRSYVEETILPSVRAPHEGASSLRRLAAIALAAAA
jgi:glucosamine 6-phosphate synthetase-like amidotransferase/phosphosugar isomerase protein